jgi:AbrB family looped-hinge helix DNA binding protein
VIIAFLAVASLVVKVTIDRAGRVVIPVAIRRQAGFDASTEIEVTLDDGGVLLTRGVSGPVLLRENGRLIARPTVASPPAVDIAAFVDEERRRCNREH